MLTFFTAHWVGCLLLISETLSLLPGKYNGVIQSIIKIIVEQVSKTS